MKLHPSAAALATLLIATPTSVVSRPQQLAFISPSSPHTTHVALAASTVDELPSDTTEANPETLLTSRNRLIALTSTLSSNSATGRFVSRPADKIKLQKAINELESLSGTMGEKERDLMIGDWSLVATANVPNSDVRRRFDNNKKSLFGKGRTGLTLFGRDGLSLDPIQKNLRKSIEVTQRIRNMDNNGKIDRVDNVIEYTPLETLSDIIPKESPLSFLGDLNVNPLQVKKSKIVLIHKAEVESVAPVLRTKIAWVSSVLNVAGTSQFFEPEGSDIFGANNPLGEFLNTGTFETPYIDEDIRVSRTRGPVFEQLRVFKRKGSDVMDSDLIDSIKAELRVEEQVEAGVSAAKAEAQVKKVTDAAQSIGDAMVSIRDDVKSAVVKDVEGVNKALGDAMDDVVGKVQDVVEDDLNEIGNAIGAVAKSIQGDGELPEAVANVTRAVTKVPQDVQKVVDGNVASVGKSIEEASDAIVKDVQDAVEADLKKIEGSISDVRDAVVGKDESENSASDDGKD